MVMNERTYKITHRGYIASQLRDPDDIATALSDLYLFISAEYNEDKFTKVAKSFKPDDVGYRGRIFATSVSYPRC